MQRQLALQDLCARLDRGTIDRAGFADRCSRLMAEAVGCGSAAFWLLIDAGVGPVAHPLERAPTGPPWGLALTARCDRFSASLRSEGAVIAQDARAHAATASFFDTEASPSPVRSMLAVPFSVNGELFGAFVCVRFDRMGRWSPPQLTALRQIAAQVSPPLARATRSDLSARPPGLKPPPWAPVIAGRAPSEAFVDPT